MTRKLTGSEDCLYLNVFRPRVTKGSSIALPVLVYIHGGSFKGGSSDPAFYGPDYFMDTRQVIVVTLQYRLGVFGFLASGHRSCKGNFGLKDQNLALHWIHSNIGAFGGDPRAVTVLGQSAGAVSVQYQMMSKRSNGLFSRAILLSGSALAFWAQDKQPETLFRRYADLAGIPDALSQHPSTIVQYLRTLSADQLLAYQESIPVLHAVLPVFRPVVEGDWGGAFLAEDPECVWKRGGYEQRPFLTGVTGYEEGAFADLYYNETVRKRLLSNWEDSVAMALEYPRTVLAAVRSLNFGGRVTKKNFINVLKVRDRLFDYPLYKTVDYYTRHGNLKKHPVSLYRFNFTSSVSTSILTNPYPIQGRGASHADNLLYLFRARVFEGTSSSSAGQPSPETAMKDYFVRLVVDYVSEGGSHLLSLVRPCRRQDMAKGFCEYLDIQRDFSVTPNRVQVAATDDFDLEMVKVQRVVDQMTQGECKG